jgi:hypothetical protein
VRREPLRAGAERRDPGLARVQAGNELAESRCVTAARSSLIAAMSDSVVSLVASRAFWRDLSLVISLFKSFTNCVDAMTSLRRSFFMATIESVRAESVCREKPELLLGTAAGVSAVTRRRPEGEAYGQCAWRPA